jgi:hyperosmotically inducible protein
MAARYFLDSSIRKTLLAAGLAAGLSGSAYAAETSVAPAPHSDDIGAAASDTVITAKVKSRFVGEDRLKKSDISVTTTNGVVTLTGSASGADARSDAETIAGAVAGVNSVDDQLKTAPSSTIAAKVDKAAAKTKRVASDSWITTKVKSEILADSVSKGFKLSVTTRHGVVALKGALANQDAIDHVKDLTEQVKGVKSVDTSLLVIAST